MTFLIRKITEQDKETIEIRVKEVPESDETACWETDLVLGYEAQDRGGARVFCLFTDVRLSGKPETAYDGLGPYYLLPPQL